jgi:sugar phosphate isomerase/epimerase|tara:strand:+ start:83 stop:838 length:756 start_codon:yes stop_codon:yes gene_type:complete
MVPKIGLKTANIFYEGKDKVDFEVLEITTKDPKLTFNIKKVLNIKKYLEGKDLSMHTQTSRIFSCNNYKIHSFNEAELDVLKAEIIVSKILGIKEFIFHLKQEKLTKQEKEKLQKIFDFAEKNKVEMIYESNQKFYSETCLDVLDSFPKLKYNLDLGHLNTAIGNKTLRMDLSEFIDNIKSRVVYVHAHNNNGIDDEHKSLEKGTLDWKFVLDKLDLSKIRKIIMEVRTTEDILNTKNLLEDYLKDKKLSK